MKRAAIIFAISLLGCESTETVPRESLDSSSSGDATSDASAQDGEASSGADTAADDMGGDTDACCPISATPACCMNFGGSRGATNPCGMVCDDIPDDLERRTDDAGCPYWFDPPGGGITCRVGPPPPDGGDGG